jgi:DNA-nicking Smr family endonuclease
MKKKKPLPAAKPSSTDDLSNEERELFLSSFYQDQGSQKFEEKLTRPKAKALDKSELAASDSELFLSFVDSGYLLLKDTQSPPERLIKAKKRGGYDVKIDLHGQFAQDAATNLLAFINENHRQGNKTLLVVHGRGYGILRKTVVSVLETHPLVADYQTAPGRLGGVGAMIVRLLLGRRLRRL